MFQDSVDKQWFADTLMVQIWKNVGTMDKFNEAKVVVASNTDSELIKTGIINGGSYTFYDNHSLKLIIF